MERVNSIQSLRGIAALAVVLHHAGLVLGAWGVDLFFVISGFIIARIAPGRSPSQFAFDRFWRLFPLYWLLSALPLFMAYYYGYATPLRTFTSITLLPGGFPYLTPAWSLIYEVLFYAAATFVLATGQWRPLVALFAVSFIANLIWPSFILGLFGYPLVLEFLAGVAIAKLPKVGKPVAVTTLIAGSTVLLCAPNVSALPFADASPHVYARALFWGLPCAMIVLGAVSLNGSKWPLTRLGDASYSLYLVHYSLARELPAAVSVPLVLMLGFAVHRWVELPIQRVKPRLKWLRPKAA